MSSKRVTASAVDWIAFAARVPKDQKKSFNNFKGKCDAYLRSVNVLPESLPRIHWDQYTSRITIPGMVEEFSKHYESLKIPYPEDKYSTKITQVEKETMSEVSEFVKASDERIAKYKVELARFEAMMPVSEMTMEEYAEHFPERTFNLDKPTMHPHTPDAQPGYVHEETSDEDH